MLYLELLFIFFNVFLEADAGFYGFNSGYRLLSHKISTISFSGLEQVQTRWIEQPVDHFNRKDRRVWLMRYFERLDLWKPNGPIFLFIGGEDEANPNFLLAGLTYELAKETNGAMFMSEHRYYGKSMPIMDKGVAKFRFLSAKQALADIEKLLRQLKSLPVFQYSKIVVIGGSYPGNLAAWLKLLYPNLIDAALSSSAPVLAKTNFYEYLETVSDDYEKYGTPGCWDHIRNKFEKYEEAFKTQSGIQDLKEKESICETSDMNIPENQHLFVFIKTGEFMSTAQYGNEYSFAQHCNKLMDSAYQINNRNLYEGVTFGLLNRQKNCYELNFNKIIDDLKNGDSSSWIYQMCAEFGFAQSTSSDHQPFGKHIPIETFFKICLMSFGETFNDRFIEEMINETNTLYGGLQPNVSNVVFVNGELDPWHRLGILKNLSDDAPAILIPRSSHCKDLLPYQNGDPVELIEERKNVKYLIKKWIGF